MLVRELAPAELQAVYALLAENGWRERLGSPSDFAALVAASQRNVVALVDGRVVGYVRALTDGRSNGYLSMLLVAREYRRRGIGRALVELVTGSSPSTTWVLRAGRPGAAEFFAKLGFVRSTVAMERPRGKTVVEPE